MCIFLSSQLHLILYFMTVSDHNFLRCLPQCLCVSPTYELALQTGKVIEQMGKYYPEVRLVYAIRGNKCKSSLLSTSMCLQNVHFVCSNTIKSLFLLV